MQAFRCHAGAQLAVRHIHKLKALYDNSAQALPPNLKIVLTNAWQPSGWHDPHQQYSGADSTTGPAVQ